MGSSLKPFAPTKGDTQDDDRCHTAPRLREVLPESCVDTTAITLTVNARDGGYYEYRPQAVVRIRERAGRTRPARSCRVKCMFPVTFRRRGASLAGQTVGEGIIADVSHAFTGIEVLDGGGACQGRAGPDRRDGEPGAT